MKRTRRLASGLCLGILLAGLTAHAAPQQAIPLTNQCSGDSFQIDLADLQDANLGQDPEERVEQLRDWLWPVLLARLEATTGRWLRQLRRQRRHRAAAALPGRSDP